MNIKKSIMRKLVTIVFFICFQSLMAQEAEIRQSIQTFFDGFHTRDSLKMKSVCYSNMILHSISESTITRKITTEKFSDFAKSIAAISKNMKFEERLLSYSFNVEGSLAHVWTPYEFYINGKLAHKGVNSFQLLKDNGLWKIIHIADTRKRAN